MYFSIIPVSQLSHSYIFNFQKIESSFELRNDQNWMYSDLIQSAYYKSSSII